jgi:hypothetical protein
MKHGNNTNTSRNFALAEGAFFAALAPIFGGYFFPNICQEIKKIKK